ncbi:DMT family transporter [Rhodospirillum sp. A1_3_36]|uniref:DMT family transporter n=1 Tax=Rhodospirillum sp. A1_3_36 TaxID=3391666 RepID=UPI0039A4B669
MTSSPSGASTEPDPTTGAIDPKTLSLSAASGVGDGGPGFTPDTPGSWADLPPNVRGAVWMLVSALAFTIMGVFIKITGQNLHAFQIAFFRCLFGLLALTPFIARMGPEILRPSRPGLHLIRLFIGTTAMFSLFYAVTHLPFAMVIAISFARPLFMLVLAAVILGEHVGWRRGLATGVGFCGVLIVLRPDPAHMEWVALAPAFSALLIACAMTIVAILSRKDKPLTILTWFAVGSSLLTLGPAIYVWQWPDPWLFAALLLVGGFGSLGQFMAVKAFGSAEASAVGPFEFSQILFAGITGFLIFDEVPDIWTFVGSVVIVGSALYILWRETRLKKEARKPV